MLISSCLNYSIFARVLLASLLAIMLVCAAAAQQPSVPVVTAPTTANVEVKSVAAEELSKRVIKTVAPAVVLIKAGNNGAVSGQGTGIVVRENGLLLTAYHVIKDNSQIQVMTKDGETYDRVEVLGVDERRDVAAIRIQVKGMHAISIRSVTDEQIGERIFTISNPLGMNWTISDGLLSGVRLADDVPGAGKGYKLLQFTAPTSPGSSGGVLVDTEGRGIGLIVGGLNGQNLNFAVPLSSVAGLIDQPSTGAKTLLAGGLSLSDKKEPEKIEERAGKAVAVAEATRTERIRDARLIYIERKTSLCKPVMLQNALLKHAAQLDEWQVKLVDSEHLADIVVEIDNMPMTFFYTYVVRDKRAGVILGAGRVTAWDCNLAAPGLATQIVNTLRTVRQPTPLKKADESKKAKTE